MPKTFYFYDLETSGLDARGDRIMQFAGQRTNESFEPIGEPHNLLIAMSDDTLPSPNALMVTGITPQKTLEEGYSERDFCQIFINDIATPDTTILGFNSLRFDDEFIRAILWRNFYDPYEWSYAEGRSRWDILDVVRMTRALRPEGVNWPVVDDKPTNRLELLAEQNGIEHLSAHDALSDVVALIGVTKLITSKQPQLFNWLYKLRDKNEVKKIVNLDTPQPFVYTSGRYDAAYEKTTIAYPVAEAEHGNVYVYDLRHDPADWVGLSESELSKIVNTPYSNRDETYKALPVKKLQYNRCPAIAPLGVLEQEDGWEKIGIDQTKIEASLTVLRQNPDFASRVQAVLSVKPDYPPTKDSEGRLYDGFVGPRDKLRAEAVRNASPEDISKTDMKFDDQRLAEMLPRYIARNMPRALDDESRAAYEQYRADRLSAQSPRFMMELKRNAERDNLTSHQQFVLEELKLWYESVIPTGPDL